MGFTTGVALLLAPVFGLADGIWWVTHAQGHGVAQLLGWAGLFTIGIAYHAIPRFRNTAVRYAFLITPSLVFLAFGIVLRQLSQGVSNHAWGAVPLAASGVLVLSGLTMFAIVIASTLSSGTKKHEPYEPWLLAAVGWAVVVGALHMVIVAAIILSGTRVAPASLNVAFIHAALYGFLINFIIGAGLRFIPPFMRLKTPRWSIVRAALVAFNVGIAWQVASWVVSYETIAWTAGGVLQAIGMALAVIGLGVFQRRAQRPEYGPGSYRRYELFVRTAYGWLLVAASAWLYVSLTEAMGWSPVLNVSFSIVRHIVALGTVTMLIFGMATRLLPVFEGARLQAPALMDVAYVLLNASVVVRVVFTIFSVPASAALLALSGVLGLAALVCFAIVVWRTLRPSAKEDYRQTIELYVAQRAGH
jgi:hypothetical protein